MWPNGQGACLEIRRSRVQDPLWPLVEFDPGSPWFNFSAALVNSQLVCLRPVGILNSCCCSVPSFRCVSLALKSPYGERSIKYVLVCIIKSRENEGTEREVPSPALGIHVCHVHESYFRRAEVFVLAEVCLLGRPHADQLRSDVWKKININQPSMCATIFSFH